MNVTAFFTAQIGLLRSSLVMCSFACLAEPSIATQRQALVIGNNDYLALPSLNNAAKDAQDIAQKLQSLGFDVILKINASELEMIRARREFEGKLASSDVALVFYAGHGIQAEGKNYLIPADAQIAFEDDLEAEAVNAQEFLDGMERSNAPLSILILDACRDNPLPKRTRSASRGLAMVDIPKGAQGAVVLYSAGAGQAAQDGPPGGNGVFTGELIKALADPALSLDQVFKAVARGVNEQTRGTQRPWNLTSVQADFFFHSEAPHDDGVRSVNNELAAEIALWESVKDTNMPMLYQAYLDQYPSGRFASVARFKIEELKVSFHASSENISPAIEYEMISPQNGRADSGISGTSSPNVPVSPKNQSVRLFDGDWTGQLEGMTTRAQLLEQNGTVRGRYVIDEYVYEIEFQLKQSIGEGVLSDATTGGQIPLDVNVNGDSLTFRLFLYGRQMPPTDHVLTRMSVVNPQLMTAGEQSDHNKGKKQGFQSDTKTTVLLQSAYGPLTEDAIVAYMEALQFCHELIGRPLNLDRSAISQMQATLVAGFWQMAPRFQQAMVRSREIWTQYQQQWSYLDRETQIAFARDVLALAWGDQAAENALGLNAGPTSSHSAGGVYGGFDVDGGKVCYDATCLDNGGGTTTYYDESGAVSAEY